MSENRYNIIILGAGIAGVAAAYYLTCKHGINNVAIVDKQQLLSLTTRCSGENFRNFWPQPCMAALTSHSFNLMQALIEEHGNVFNLKQTGYRFVSRNPSPFAEAPGIREMGAETLDYLSPDIRSVTHIEEAGAIEVYALGSLLLKEARSRGVQLITDEVTNIDLDREGYTISTPSQTLAADKLIVATGPFVNHTLEPLGVQLPIESICQRKFVIPDPAGVIPRDMPFTICADAIRIPWTTDEAQMLQDDESYAWMLDELPVGLHIKPEGANQIKMGWAFNRQAEAPRWQCDGDAQFPEIVMRGAATFIPSLKTYTANMPTPVHQFAGYYTRTPENWPIIGALPVPGLFTIAALSGFGTMAACAAGEMCADVACDASPADFAPFFAFNRYQDPDMQALMAATDNDGQL